MEKLKAVLKCNEDMIQQGQTVKETHKTADYRAVYDVHQAGQSQTHNKTHNDTEQLCAESGRSNICTVTLHSQLLEIIIFLNSTNKNNEIAQKVNCCIVMLYLTIRWPRR